METKFSDPRLSDFSKDQLDEAAIAVNQKIELLQNQLKGYRQNEDMARMFAQEILQWEVRIENLRAVYNQLFNAGTLKELERRAASN